MFCFRTSAGPAEVAFTDRHGGVSDVPFDSLNLALDGDDAQDARDRNHRIVLGDFGPGDAFRDVHQVHGGHVDLVEGTLREEGHRARADAIVASSAGETLMVRAADCVPVLLVDPDAAVIGAAHCGRLGLLAGIIANTVTAMHGQGATRLTAWVGPHVCGRCYEVPSEVQSEVADVVPASRATTSWGTPALDLGAGVRAQLEEHGVTVNDVSRCTLESPDLYSYRRDGARAGRQAGLVRLREAPR